MDNLFRDIIGYIGEVSQPNEPRVVGYFLDEWAKDTQKTFEAWLEVHDSEVAAKALRDAADELRQQGVEPWYRNSVAINTLWFLADQISKEVVGTDSWEVLAIGGPLDGETLRITDRSEVPDSYRPWKEFIVHDSFQLLGFKHMVSYIEYIQHGDDILKYALDYILSKMSEDGADMRTYSVETETTVPGDIWITAHAVGRREDA